MSQPSEMDRQVDALKEFGVPIKSGIRVVRPDEPAEDKGRAGSGLWIHRWAKHACQNYQTVSRCEGIRFLNDACYGLPAFVVGIGPSLDDCLPELKRAEGRAVIISTDAAFRPLLANQIKPDLVISFDCKAEQSTLWETVPEHGVACLFDTCAHPDAIKSWKGPVLFYNHWHQQDEFSHRLLPYIFPNVGQLPSAGTVGNVGLLAAKLLGCGPIYAVGMDFCYRQTDSGWRYRAKDYRMVDKGEGMHWIEAENSILYDNDQRVARSFDYEVGGSKYRTDPELAHYYEACVMVCREYKVPVVNVAPGSMLSSQTETVPLLEVLDKHLPNGIQRGRHILPFLSRIMEPIKWI